MGKSPFLMGKSSISIAIFGQTLSGWWLTYPSEKYESVGKDDIPYMKWKIKFMFQTTNQLCFDVT